MKIPTYISTDFPINPLEKLALNLRFPTDGLEELFIDAQTLGNLMIFFDADHEARVLAAAEAHLLPERVEREGSRLIIEAKNFKKFLRQGQGEKIRIEVHVPTHTRLNIHFGAGVLVLAGGEGAVHIDGGVGEISGYTHARAVDVHLSAGDVTLHNLHGQAAIKLNVGSITLNWSELSGDEQVAAKCNLGSIDLHLPPAVAVVEDQGGAFLRKTVDVPFSTHISAEVSFGGLDVVPNMPVPVFA